jgi:DNA topoisomerase-1
VRIGKFGPFLEVAENGETVTASIPEGIAPADLSEAQVAQLVKAKTQGPDVLGTDPRTGEAVYLLNGRFGPFVQLGKPEEKGARPRRASLPKGVTPEKVTLEDALRWLSLPRTLGSHPETGKEIQAGVGRFGPFVVHDGDFRSLAPGDDVYTVGLPRALELLAQPKGGRSRSTPQALRVVGAHPADGEPIQLFEGRFGPYLKHGQTNASLPKGAAPEQVTVEQAVQLLAERAQKEAAGGGRRGGRKSAAKKGASKTATKTAAKGAAKKAPAKKSASKAAKKR